MFGFVFDAMGSRGEVQLDADGETTAQCLARVAINEVKRIEAKYSRYRTDSIVSRVNRAAGIESVDCDEETLSLLSYADRLFQSSDGLFDITSGVLRRAWDFRKSLVPSEESLARILEFVGWDKVRCDTSSVFLARPGMELDFGGFGKEYAADRAASLLAQQGVRYGYVNLAGDMRVIGPKPDGAPWNMGIQDPRNGNCLIATIPISAGGLATSGDYERYIEVDGRRYCHVINPRTGYPVSYWRSVSVVAPYCVAAGSLTTIAMLKEKEGLEFLDNASVIYLAVDSSGNSHSNSLQDCRSPDTSTVSPITDLTK